MDRNEKMQKILKNHKCKDCMHISYWDFYFCKLGHHKTQKDFLSLRSKKECAFYQRATWEKFWT